MAKSKEFSLDDIDLNDPLSTLTKSTSRVEEVMKKSVIQPGFEQQQHIANSNISLRKQRLERKMERERTRGPQWFNLAATSITPEVENNLKVVQMRSILDSKHFYKKNDLKVLPKYFEIGKVLDSPADFYHNRVPKKERKRTIVEELLADAEFQKKSKKKYREIVAQRNKTHYKAHKIAKRLKKNKKK
ncbi:deoxynucleotidyltransferase terminal-interacting protein 2 [Macrosteles quadrilineatus]|uniref:deoxynucleotidyltransferase terminal-interacting protein 2 n=1 Tax=Macrosteles quadrilineatus TaxID=74068 RepID=UPI0023E297FD|nr:deoxynucleotidyltransferase terminal-interacting protein 2 [Macrosteles quadrilineatus]